MSKALCTLNDYLCSTASSHVGFKTCHIGSFIESLATSTRLSISLASNLPAPILGVDGSFLEASIGCPCPIIYEGSPGSAPETARPHFQGFVPAQACLCLASFANFPQFFDSRRQIVYRFLGCLSFTATTHYSCEKHL